jgi:integrase
MAERKPGYTRRCRASTRPHKSDTPTPPPSWQTEGTEKSFSFGLSSSHDTAPSLPDWDVSTVRTHSGSLGSQQGSAAHACRKVTLGPLSDQAPGILQVPPNSHKVDAATPAKRRGKSMSRRTGQNGHVEKSGKWWVVRWWMDVQGKEEREHKRAKICPVVGPGSLSESARKRRAREIIAGSGADTEEHFKRIVRQADVTTFRVQSAIWLESVKSRKRKPVANATIESWEGCLRNWLIPEIKDLPVCEVNNAVLKRLVATMAEGGLAPKSINTYAQVVKMVVASVTNKEGEELYPRKWNHVFADMPVVEKSKQNTPSFSSEIMTGLATWKHKRERMLFMLCGAGGMRIGEVLGVEIDKHLSPDFMTISVTQKVRHCKVEGRLKTENSLRMVDLHPEIASLLTEFVGGRRSGFLFCTRNGKPLATSNILRRHLHPALKKLNYVNSITGTDKAGNHAFRRFRNTYLRNRTLCPEGLRNFWLGHAGEDMGDLYDKIKEDFPFRREWAEKAGFGFELPPLVPNVPKIGVKDDITRVA